MFARLFVGPIIEAGTSDEFMDSDGVYLTSDSEYSEHPLFIFLSFHCQQENSLLSAFFDTFDFCDRLEYLRTVFQGALSLSLFCHDNVFNLGFFFHNWNY